MTNNIEQKHSAIEWKDGRKEGNESAREFLASCTIEDRWWMAAGMMSSPDWEPCQLPDLKEQDIARYKYEKKSYEDSFRHKIHSEVEMDSLNFYFYLQGLNDGDRWSLDLATIKLHKRLVTNFSENKVYLDNNRLFSFNRYSVSSTYVPAKIIVDWVHTGLYGEEYMDVEVDGVEFREFWAPLLSEPIETVIMNLISEEGTRGHKLRVPAYVQGFVDGAIGLSQQSFGDL